MSMNFIDENVFLTKMKLKLDEYPLKPEKLMVTIETPLQLKDKEKEKIFKNIKKTNMCFFEVKDSKSFSKEALLKLTNQLGLVNSEGNLCADINHITSIENQNSGVKAGYIPFSNKALTWHTDGYYNSEESKIQGMVLYCAQPAKKGGVSMFYDHERLFFELYKANPLFVEVLSKCDVLTIPENTTTKGYFRAEQSGPVFSVNSALQNIHMRYSARTRNIIWGKTLSNKQSVVLNAALNKITSLLSEYNPYIYNLKLRSGQGVICNNVLHNRTAFEDDENTRLFYRARFYNHIG